MRYWQASEFLVDFVVLSWSATCFFSLSAATLSGVFELAICNDTVIDFERGVVGLYMRLLCAVCYLFRYPREISRSWRE